MAKCKIDISEAKRLPAQRDKHMVVKWRIGAPTLQIPLKRRARRIVHGDEPRLFKF